MPIIRNEELLLIRAEANIGQGNLGAAEDDINVVRAAAGLGPVDLTSANAINQLIYERMFSLWHILHVPFVFMLVISGVVHVIAVHMY